MDWIITRKFISDVIGIPEYILDYIAVDDILRRSLSGRSNRAIAKDLKMKIYYIVHVLDQFLESNGWEEHAEYNPLALYYKSGMDYDKFKEEMAMSYHVYDEQYFVICFNMCEKFRLMREEVKKYYV